MADGKLVLQHKVFEIEVNDNGDTISVDPLDLEFPLQFQKCYERIQKIQQEIKAEELIIRKKENIEGEMLSSQEQEILQMLSKKYKEMRNAIDNLFGEGTSMKVFGESNWATMFAEFFFAIVPLLEEAGIRASDTFEAIKNKYGGNENKEL